MVDRIHAVRSVCAVIVLAGLSSPPVFAQNTSDALKAVELEPIEIIGTLAPVRSELETSVPVDVLDERRLGETGASETGRAIQAAAPSFNFSSSTISDGTDALRPATLRGLGPDQTLVLINGKRRHPSALLHVNRSVGRGTAGIDMNAIPLASIGRVEILRDGAGARYGSDAIAGVINLVLRELDEGGEARATVGQTYEGDGLVRHGSVVHGLRVGDGGFFTLTADFRDRDDTNRAGRTGVCQYGTSDGNCDEIGKEKVFGRKNFRIGDADSLSRSLWFNTETPPILDNAALYAFGGWTRRDNTSAGFYRRANQADRNPIHGGKRFYEDGFLPLINTEIEDFSIGGGAALALGDWDLDASLVHGRNDFDFGVSNSLNAYRWQREGVAVTSVDSGGLGYRQTLLGLGGQRSVSLFDTSAEVAIGAEARIDDYIIRAGERNSWYGCTDTGDPDTNCAEAASGGIQVFPGFRPENEVDESRASGALYADSEMYAGDRTNFGLAVRGERFEDFGTTVNGKVSGRYEVSAGLALRGSASTGFRAPSLHQKYFNNVSTQFEDGVAKEVGTFRNDGELARQLGIPKLDEEISRNVAIGFVWNPSPGFSITLDAYQIDIEDRIMISNTVDEGLLSDGCGGDTTCENAVRAAMAGKGEAQFFLNGGDTRTRGIDLVATHERELAGGVLDLTASASWSRTRFEKIFRGPGLLGGLGDGLFGRREKAFIERSQPSWRLNLEGKYLRGPWSLSLGTRVYGSYKVPETDQGDLQKFSTKTLVDTQINYTLPFGLTFTLGADNLFDVYPDKKKFGNSRAGCIGADGRTGEPGACAADAIVDSEGVFTYSRRSAPFGINGGFYYARLTWRY